MFHLALYVLYRVYVPHNSNVQVFLASVGINRQFMPVFLANQPLIEKANPVNYRDMGSTFQVLNDVGLPP